MEHAQRLARGCHCRLLLTASMCCAVQVKSRDSVQTVSTMLDDPDCSKEVRGWDV